MAAGGYALVYGGQILIAASAEMATAGRVALEGCKTNPALYLNNVGIFVADTVAPEAAIGTGVLAAGTVKVLGNTKEGAKNLAEGLSNTSKPLLRNAKPDTDAVASLIENEKLYAGKGATELEKPTQAWGGYLDAEKAVQQSAAMKQQVMDVRAGLPSALRREGNVAVANISVEGLPSQVSAHSRIDAPTLAQAAQDIVGKSSGIFTTQTLPNKAGAMIPRATDSEAKILDNIAQKLGNNTFAKGTVNIFTERPACASCLSVVDQFKVKYPNIQVNVLDNNGIVLRPPRKN
ncbi:deaminase domain-containing protein [Photorhabdus sp. RM96S]|uniref:deaminase domain-containing protein n=1 Tax=Photorhabdus sp. RM96S TaxID=3342822 RepID=UPI0036DA0462